MSKKEDQSPDRKRLVDLFHAFDKKTQEWEAAKAKVEELAEARSLAVKEISEVAGTGPFSYHGDVLTIFHRGPTDKNPDAKETWYFRGKKDASITEVG